MKQCQIVVVAVSALMIATVAIASHLLAAQDEYDRPDDATPDEPMAESFSPEKALQFLDAAAVSWTREFQCGTCHTNYPYMMARPVFTNQTRAVAEVRGFFEGRASNWDNDPPRWDTEVVATAVTLAIHDSKTSKKLQPVTRAALDRMWTLQQETGSWDWLKCNWQPLEADDYYGVAFAAVGVGVAPDGYAATPLAQAGLVKMRRYLEQNAAPSLHHKLILLWASRKLPDLMNAEDSTQTVEQTLQLQRPDGGWNLTSLGGWQRRDKTPNDPSPSDGYGTGLAIHVLRQTGLAADHPAIQRGISWLKANQRESGRWFTRSINNDNFHFLSTVGTAYAVMALDACGQLERTSRETGR
jgi:squalene-hopene/tetraprenyl-beta-curcumene cyclase